MRSGHDAEGDQLPVCAQYPTETWWLEPDLAQEGEDDATQTNNFLEAETRAGLLCYDCPVVSECRLLGATEEFNIWGGLTSQQRRRVARGLTAIPIQPLPAFSGGLDRVAIDAFKRGASCRELAAQLGMAEDDILLALTHLLRRTQRSWEKQNEDVCEEVSRLVRETDHPGRGDDRAAACG